jgi:hypothetical protein
MRVGLIGRKEIVYVTTYDNIGNHVVRFVNWRDKLIMPKDFRDAPWGYDAYRVFLPEDVIERRVSQCFPGIRFFDGNEAGEIKTSVMSNRLLSVFRKPMSCLGRQILKVFGYLTTTTEGV